MKPSTSHFRSVSAPPFHASAPLFSSLYPTSATDVDGASVDSSFSLPIYTLLFLPQVSFARGLERDREADVGCSPLAQLLETVIKNCGDILHMHVAERDVLHEMVKIVKKKSDPRVKEKVLVLIDTWQECFGGPRARYPQYYAAYHELVRAGAEFPKRSDRSAPLFNGQSQAARNMRSPDQQDEAESSAGNDLPALSMSEIQNARGIMDVLAEMLNALGPGNREGLRQEVIVDLVDGVIVKALWMTQILRGVSVQ